MRARPREIAKQAISSLPLTAELYQTFLGDVPSGGYSLARLRSALPSWAGAATQARSSAHPDRRYRVLVIGYLKWWLEFSTALGLVFSGMGHDVELGFIPYRTWMEPVTDFDARRQAAYVRNVLAPARRHLHLTDLSRARRGDIPDVLGEAISKLSLIDVQYTMQREDLDLAGDASQSDLYRLRLERNLTAAARIRDRMAEVAFDVIVIPNGSILEFGATYLAARARGIPVVTFEFGEQRERMWLSRNEEVMRHDTAELWTARGHEPLRAEEAQRIEGLMAARRGGAAWSNFGRRWQKASSEGAEAARRALQLSKDRPVILLCTNVVGDSLTLGRQVFTRGMSDWLSLTVQILAERPEAQLVVRVHPGEILGAGHPSEEIVHAALPVLPAHVRLVPPDSPLNTYDLIEIADLGLVYTTTVGLEMAMAGIPVVVAGQTHYRSKGFTLDPASPEEFRSVLERLLTDPSAHRLGRPQVDMAWRYAYRFFFDFPRPFPWHLLHFWDDVAVRPVESLMTADGKAPYQATLESLLGTTTDWGRDGR